MLAFLLNLYASSDPNTQTLADEQNGILTAISLYLRAQTPEGLNEALAGGLPEFSFNLLAGGPGAWKTTLVHQICFALATPERPALYITVRGETPVKLPPNGSYGTGQGQFPPLGVPPAPKEPRLSLHSHRNTPSQDCQGPMFHQKTSSVRPNLLMSKTRLNGYDRPPG